MESTTKNVLLKLSMIGGLFALTGHAIADSLSCAKRGYDNGIYSKAAKLFKPLAREGNPDAQYYLGLMYGAGQGVPQNAMLAYMWSTIAVTHTRDGELRQNASSFLTSIEKTMTAQQIAKAQEAATTCTLSKFQNCD